MRPSEVYVFRAASLGLLRLSYLHHYVMDHIFLNDSDDITFDDVLREMLADPVICNDPAMSANPVRVKLVVIRAFEGLVLAGMLQEKGEGSHQYSRCLPPSRDP